MLMNRGVLVSFLVLESASYSKCTCWRTDGRHAAAHKCTRLSLLWQSRITFKASTCKAYIQGSPLRTATASCAPTVISLAAGLHQAFSRKNGVSRRNS